jgi:hypothetical protein
MGQGALAVIGMDTTQFALIATVVVCTVIAGLLLR